MAIASTMVWEIRSTATAANVNGGGFNPSNLTGNTSDWSQQPAAQYNLTGITSAAANAIMLHASASADMVGNVVHVISGTNATAGFYEILSVVAGVSITVDRNWCTNVALIGVANIGGALSLQNANDATTLTTTYVAGNKVWIKSGTYNLTGTWSIGSKSGTANSLIAFEGYSSTRGDKPTGSTRPLFNMSAGGVFQLGDFVSFTSLQIIGTVASTLFQCSQRGYVYLCSFTNKTTTANQAAFVHSSYLRVMQCEFVCYNGYGITTSQACNVSNSYFHDSVVGIQNTQGGDVNTYTNNLFINCTTAAIRHTASSTIATTVQGNTFYGAENKIGIGLSLATGSGNDSIYNNIFYGLTSGITHADSSQAANGTSIFLNYNNFYNNTSDVTNVTKGLNDIALSPGFTSVGQYTGTTATTSGSTLTDTGANFANVVAGRDFLQVVSGTGVTVGMYAITLVTSTAIATDNSLGTGTGVTYQITYGRNLLPGVNMNNAGALGTITGNASIPVAYQSMGALQNGVYISTDPGQSNTRLSTGYSINGVSKTGTLVVPSLADTKTGVAGDGGTGTYDGSDRWTDPDQANVKDTVVYKANSLTNNKIGTLTVADNTEVLASIKSVKNLILAE